MTIQDHALAVAVWGERVLPEAREVGGEGENASPLLVVKEQSVGLTLTLVRTFPTGSPTGIGVLEASRAP